MLRAMVTDCRMILPTATTMLLCAVVSLVPPLTATNKYSAEVNQPEESASNYRSMLKPFRMQKINLVWEKAQKRLTDQKLKNLYTDLKQQDKEELLCKKLKSEGQDKDGLKEASLRRNLAAIIMKYELDDHFKRRPEDNESFYDKIDNSLNDNYLNKMIFRDKKLNKLWLKAEKSGFTDEELKTLKEEFQHHQEKINQYYQLMDVVNQPKDINTNDEYDNSLESVLQGEVTNMGTEKRRPDHQTLKDKHKEIKEGYDSLASKIVLGLGKEFEEANVQTLWQMAQNADFSSDELESLKEELHHFERRLKKLRHFEGELEFAKERHETKPDGPKHLLEKVKDLNHKVNKMHRELEMRIKERHLEL